MELRRATTADGDGIAAVRLAIGDAHDDSGVSDSYRQHLIDHGHLWVAVDRVGDREVVVGFAGARDIGAGRMLSDLFIDPSRHGGGIGKALLNEVLAGSVERFTFASTDQRALPLYLRFGMFPRWPLLYLAGPAKLELPERREPPSTIRRSARIDEFDHLEVSGTADAAAIVDRPIVANDLDDRAPDRGRRFDRDGFVPRRPGDVREVEVAEALAIESAITGLDRAVEFGYWLARGATSCVAVDDYAVGLIHRVGDTARVEHLAVAETGDSTVDATAAVAAIGRWTSADRLLAYVRGDTTLARDLLDSRFSIVDSDFSMSSDPALVPPRLAVVHPGLM